MAVKDKEMIGLVADLRALLPELLLLLGALDPLHPPPELSSRIRSARSQLETLVARARAMEEERDCMPAAVKGRAKPPGA